MDKVNRIGNDAGEILVVEFIALELCLAVFCACNVNLIQRSGILENEHCRGEYQLPLLVLQGFRNDYIKRQIDLSVTLCKVLKTGFDNNRFELVVCNHLAALIIFYGVHNDYFLILGIDNRNGLLNCRIALAQCHRTQVGIFDNLCGCRQVQVTQRCNLPLHTATRTANANKYEKDDNMFISMFH